ncbi:hypothetical protein FACS1894172_11010 [Spirochaetia bacterium]|nr:hypothetical protein FACS1894172_11010 [Spirochaetia bacterium]
MKVALFSFIAISLFMVHEFEEIIFIQPWLEYSNNKAIYEDEIFVKGKDGYPSTSAIAFMIGEEYLLSIIILILAILIPRPELAVGILFAHTLHLFSHIIDAIRFHCWPPGSVTAVITIPLIIILFVLFFKQNKLNILSTVITTILVSVLLIGNLRLLHYLAPHIQNWINNYY